MSDSSESDIEETQSLDSDSALEESEGSDDETPQEAVDEDEDEDDIKYEDVTEAGEIPSPISKKHLKSYLQTEVMKPPSLGAYKPPATSTYVPAPATQVYAAPVVPTTYVVPPPATVTPNYQQPISMPLINQPIPPINQPVPVINQPVPIGGISAVTAVPAGITYQPATKSPKKQGERVIKYNRTELSELRLEDLKNLCKERKITGFSNKKKDDLVTLLLSRPLTGNVVISIEKSNIIEKVTIVPDVNQSIPGITMMQQTAAQTNQPFQFEAMKVPLPASLIPTSVPVESKPNTLLESRSIPAPVPVPVPVPGQNSEYAAPLKITPGIVGPTTILGNPSQNQLNNAPQVILPNASSNPLINEYQAAKLSGNPNPSQVDVNVAAIEANKSVLGVNYSSELNKEVNEHSKV